MDFPVLIKTRGEKTDMTDIIRKIWSFIDPEDVTELL